MATYYVSNVAANGYALGVDTNDGLSMAAPFLTVAKGCLTATSADTVTINPTTTPYSEDSGSGYLQAGSALVVQGDPTLYPLVPTIRATLAGAIRIANFNGSTSATWANVTLDGQSRSGQAGFSFSGAPASLTFSRVKWINFVQYVIGNPASACAVTLDRCVTDSTCTSTTVFQWTTSTTLTSLLVKGGTWYAPAGSSAVFFLNTSAISGSVTFQADDAGGLVDFTGNAGPYNVRAGGTIGGALTLGGLKHNATPGGVFLTGLTVTGAISITGGTSTDLTAQAAIRLVQVSAPSVAITGNTHSGIRAFYAVTARGVLSFAATGNTVTVKTGASADTMQAVALGDTAPRVTGNTITVQTQTGTSSWGGIKMGADGLNSNTTNSAARTGTLSLGNASGTALQANSFTTFAANSSNDQTHIAAFDVYLSKSGTPTGSITGYLYSDNAGVPGTLLRTSAATVSAASLTTSAALYGFTFTPYASTAGTKYWLVLGVSGGTTDASNYVLIDYNATVTGGSSAAGTSVPAWTADAAKCWRFQSYIGAFGMAPIVSGNTISMEGSGVTTAGQLITLGGCNGGTVSGNYLIGKGYYPIVIKDGLIGTTYVAANIVRLDSANVGSGAAVLVKSAQDVRCYQNTLRVEGTNLIPAALQFSGDSRLWTNTLQSTSFRVANNILLRPNTGAGPIYRIDAGSTTTAIWINTNWLYTATPANVGGGTLSAWQTLGYDLSSTGVSTLPGLANDNAPTVPADFKPSATSPVIGIGADLTAQAPAGYDGALFVPRATLGAYSLFGGELLARSASATAVYAVLRDAVGRPYNASTRAFEQYVATNLSAYAIGMAQYGASGVWGGNMPAVAIGRYLVDYRSRAGGTAAESDTPITDPMSKSTVNWTGTSEIRPIALGRFAVAA